jgi:glycosyltransferase involved in cell wall biosynthesis
MERKNKKIVLMGDFFSEPGGMERILQSQGRVLRKAGFDVSFAFAYVDEALRKERLDEFPVIEYSRFIIKNETMQICWSLLDEKKMKSFIGTDLVICHFFPASYFALRMQKKFNIPYLLHLHHPPQFLYASDINWANNSFKRKFSYIVGLIFKPYLRKFDKYCVNNAKDYLVESESVKTIVKEIYGISGTVTYPAFDPLFDIVSCCMNDIKRLGITKKYVLGSGRIVHQKRFDYLIDAFSRLDNKDMHLVIAGKYSSDIKKTLENIARAKGIDLLFLGPLAINDLVKVYNLASATVLTCPKEWFGLVAVEAMACGCPVVAWRDNFGPQESVTEGVSGLLATPYETIDLAKKMDMVISKQWNKEIIRNSVLRFSEDAMAEKLVKKVDEYM